MNRPCRGKLLLICNDEFCSQSTTDSDPRQQQQQLSERRGADVDVYNITMLFKRLQFNVDYHNNLTAAVSTDWIVEFPFDIVRGTSLCNLL